jgi:hypothetical protein
MTGEIEQLGKPPLPISHDVLIPVCSVGSVVDRSSRDRSARARTLLGGFVALMLLLCFPGCFSTRPNYEPTFKLLESTLGNLRRDYKRGFVKPTGDPATDHPYRESKIRLIDSALRNISAARGERDEKK